MVVNTVLVFSFVALWHDLTFRLLAWGWLVSLFIIPELCAKYLLPASKVCKPNGPPGLSLMLISVSVPDPSCCCCFLSHLSSWPVPFAHLPRVCDAYSSDKGHGTDTSVPLGPYSTS